MINIGTENISKIYVGSTPVKMVYFGGELVYPWIVTVQELIDQGFGTVSGTFVTLSPSTPYNRVQITDFDQHIDASVPRFKWNNYNLPSGIYSSDLISRYNGRTMSVGPTPGLFWGVDFSTCSNFSITFRVSEWLSVGDGIFNTRQHNMQYHPGPTNLTLTLTGSDPQGTLQTLFSHTTRTEKIRFAASGCWCYAHGVNGLFEGCTDLETIEFSNIVMGWNGSGGWNNVQYLCHWCHNLKVFPLGFPNNARDHIYNTIKPRNRSGDSGGNNYAEAMFSDCRSLTTIEPVLDFSLLTAKPNDIFYNCVSLEDMWLKNLNCTWDFTDCPNLSIDSISYIMYYSVDKTGSQTCTMTFGGKYLGEIDETLMEETKAKNWNINFGAANTTMIYKKRHETPLSGTALSQLFSGASTYTETNLGNGRYKVVYDGTSLGRINDVRDSLTDLEYIEIYGPVTEIAAFAFHDLQYLEHVSIEGLNGPIGEYAFFSDWSLTSVTLGTVSNGSIGGYAFGYCDSLSSFDITGMTSVNNNAFSYSSSSLRLYCNDVIPLFTGLHINTYPSHALIVVPNKVAYQRAWPDHAFQIVEPENAVYINYSECMQCGACVEHCPISAIKNTYGPWIIDQSECTNCGACVDQCPVGAIYEL